MRIGLQYISSAFKLILRRTMKKSALAHTGAVRAV